uniref:Cytochrome c oxidase subunit 2 n=1 Tax=Philotrypesis pilosa TaxID=358048 RepID=G8EEK0_9HYME|nr:cytochrome c oxidase II [Philotrypesis pilosa]
MSMWSQIMLQDANSPIMENMVMFYDYSMVIITLVISLIMYLLFFMFLNKLTNRFLLDGQMIEIIWTVIPIFFLIFLAIPSLKLLYLSDEINNPNMSIKVMGHQWYWSYELNDFKSINFDSFMIKDENNNDLFRLLDVDNRLILPFNSQIRFLISSYDVIHSFTIPSLGSKVDAVPGRINQINLFLKRPGIFFGQCSEICGINHSFMPIVIEFTSLKNFINWINK